MSEDYHELEEQSINVVQGDAPEPLAKVVDENSPEAVKQRRWVLIKAILGEMLCTFLFIYIVCATSANFVRLNTVNNPVVGALCTGFASVALIYSFADVSGAHFNPAVTFATIVTRKTGLTKGLMYIGAQLIGSVFSCLILLATFPENYEKGNVAAQVAVVPGTDADIANAFLTELILTFILVYVIFAVAFDTVDSKNVQVVNTPGGGKQKQGGNSLTIYTTSGATKAGFAPIAIGFTLGFLVFMGSSVSGGAFNPARVFGPAIVGGVWTDHWMYWIADFLGAGVAGYTQRFFATASNKSQ
jgi:glycerol uptake facilitator-like aquaporin